MKQDLTTLLSAVPFVPFTVKIHVGKMHQNISGRLPFGDS